MGREVHGVPYARDIRINDIPTIFDYPELPGDRNPLNKVIATTASAPVERDSKTHVSDFTACEMRGNFVDKASKSSRSPVAVTERPGLSTSEMVLTFIFSDVFRDIVYASIVTHYMVSAKTAAPLLTHAPQ
jgi:hypothetical protein